MPTKEEQEEADRLAEEAKRKAAEETSETEEATEEDLSLDQLKEKLAASEKARKAANKESKDRRLALEALEAEKKTREEKDLSEAQKATKRAEEAETARAALEKEVQELRLKDQFKSKAADLKLSFASSQAESDAFSHLPRDTEEAELEDAIKAIVKARPYLLGVADPNKTIGDGSQKGILNKKVVENTTLEKKRASVKLPGI